MHEHADRDHTEPPPCHPKHTRHPVTRGRIGSLGHDTWEPCNTPDAQARGEVAAALTALADALDTTPAQLAAGPEHDDSVEDAFIGAVLDQRIPDDVGALGLTVGNIVTIARWLAPIASTLAHLERRDAERALADERARTLAMAERHSEALHRATERAKTAEAAVARVHEVVDGKAGGFAQSIRAALAGTAPDKGCGCLTHPDRALSPDGDPGGCYCDCSDTGREDCDHAEGGA